MGHTKLWIQAVAISCAFGMELFMGSFFSLQAHPPIPTLESLQSGSIPFAYPMPPEDPGAPGGRQRGGAGRGNQLESPCLQPRYETDTNAAVPPCLMPTMLVALVPQTQTSTGDRPFVWGLTSQSHPAFWFFVPNIPNTPGWAEFVLQDQWDGIIHREQFQIPPSHKGVMGVSIPKTQPPLQVSQRYHWTFSIRYNPNQFNRSMAYVRGTIYRQELAPQVQEQLTTSSPIEQVALYAQAGIWHDALTGLAQLRQARPQDRTLKQYWSSLLLQVNLTEIATSPISRCCTLADLDLGAQ